MVKRRKLIRKKTRRTAKRVEMKAQPHNKNRTRLLETVTGLKRVGRRTTSTRMKVQKKRAKRSRRNK